MSVVARLPAIRRNAEALRQQGHPERARDLLEPALDVSLDSFGPDHPDALETMRLLALAERDLGNLTGARRLLEEALAGGQYSLGPTDPLMLTMSAQLAGIAAELGNRYEARRNFDMVARMGPGVLGVEHPAVAAARRYLGGSEPVAGRPDGACAVGEPNGAYVAGEPNGVNGAAMGRATVAERPPAPEPVPRRPEPEPVPRRPEPVPVPRRPESGPRRPEPGSPGPEPGPRPPEPAAAPATAWGQAPFDPADVTAARPEEPPPRPGPSRPEPTRPTPGRPEPGGPPGPDEPSEPAGPWADADGSGVDAPWADEGRPGSSWSRQPAGTDAVLPDTDMDTEPEGGRHASPEPMLGPVRLSTGTGTREPTPPPSVGTTRRFESAATLPGGDAGAPEPADDRDDEDDEDFWDRPRQWESTGNGHAPAVDPDPMDPDVAHPDAMDPDAVHPDAADGWTDGHGAGDDAPGYATAQGSPRYASAGDDEPGHDLIYRPDATVVTTRRPATRTIGDPWTDRRPVPVSHAAPHHHRTRAVILALVAIGVLAVASAGAAAATWLATWRGTAPATSVSPAPYLPPAPTASPAPSEPLAAPTGVVLRDGGSTVTLTWQDPTGGTVPFLVAGGHAGQTMRAFQTVGPGVHTYTVRGLNPSLDYCFTVIAVYGTDRLGTSDLVCTSRHSPSPGATT